jgi:thioredoxin 1
MNKKIISIAAVVIVVVVAIGYVAINGDKATKNNETATTVSNQQANAADSSAAEQQPASGSKSAQASATTSSSAAPAPQQTPTSPGAYITYADYSGNKAAYDGGKVVYFFNAKWCPTCQALTKDISAKTSSIPAGTTIVSVDYDQYTDLKKQYGVTIQHTLVQVNKDGAQIKKWSGSPDLTSVLSQI